MTKLLLILNDIVESEEHNAEQKQQTQQSSYFMIPLKNS